MADIARAPFTPAQVQSLNAYQQDGSYHPFTCSGGGGPHSDRPERRAVLVAEEDGWHCPVSGCTHKQTWALAVMTDWSWRPSQPTVSARQAQPGQS